MNSEVVPNYRQLQYYGLEGLSKKECNAILNFL